MSHEIWVLAERTESGDLAAISRELLGRGRELADAAAVPLAVLVLGAGVSDLARQAFGYGADR
ncbi:MAG TPA: electron transfer flavoprotein subunit alpha/FixB family protein, partial [Roseiflexaceae bacterium]|nr:electron transfer flavoprotein subunit alpha/FixB family protein [Roseiflexaceae bacterium]